MYRRALAGYEKALSPDYTSTLDTVNNLGTYGDRMQSVLGPMNTTSLKKSTIPMAPIDRILSLDIKHNDCLYRI